MNAARLVPVAAEGDAAGDSVAESLRKAVADLDLAKKRAVVVVPRSLMELRTIHVPRIAPEELPDAIRFQAQRHFAQMNENWAVDYVLFPELPGEEMLTALVAAMSPANRQRIEVACQTAQLELEHVVPRSLEIARFARDTGQIPAIGGSAVLCVSEGSAELVVYIDGKVVMVRDMRLPSERSALAGAMRSEMMLTTLAAASVLKGVPIDVVLLVATPELAEIVEPVVAESLEGQIKHLDPTTIAAKVEGVSLDELASRHAHRIVALAGAAQIESAAPETKIDFLHPKRRPPKRQYRRQIAMGVAAAVLLLGAGLSWWYRENNRLNEELAELTTEIESKQLLLEKAEEKIKLLREVDTFLKGSPNFLAELAYVTERMPPAEQMVMGAPTMTATREGFGVMSMNVMADSQPTISRFEQSVRDQHHEVRGSNYRELDEPTRYYRWQAKETIVIRDRGWDLVDQLTGKKPRRDVNKPDNQGEQTGEKTEERPESPASDSDNAASPKELAAGPAAVPAEGASAGVDSDSEEQKLPEEQGDASEPAIPDGGPPSDAAGDVQDTQPEAEAETSGTDQEPDKSKAENGPDGAEEQPPAPQPEPSLPVPDENKRAASPTAESPEPQAAG